MDEFKEPESMNELVYYTLRDIGTGNAICWVERQLCPKCKKALMGKPKVKGKVQTRAKEYVCPSCGYTQEKSEYESGLTAKIIYTCPNCGNKGKTKVPFKRKKIKGVETLRLFCEKCKEPIDITKKLKEK